MRLSRTLVAIATGGRRKLQAHHPGDAEPLCLYVPSTDESLCDTSFPERPGGRLLAFKFSDPHGGTDGHPRVTPE